MGLLKKILDELVEIRKELQAIRRSLEPYVFVPEDSDGIRCSGESSSTHPVQANRE